ncbi:hypothetical protein [Agrococcus beijingensis]|uniref:hypothetical protein n=1 Tax=Agrococcus beijingensis TaxID=3068634 RepID=UPI002742783C|nr:hypothetical protein [Agrococcus sp. REN33]
MDQGSNPLTAHCRRSTIDDRVTAIPREVHTVPPVSEGLELKRDADVLGTTQSLAGE